MVVNIRAWFTEARAECTALHGVSLGGEEKVHVKGLSRVRACYPVEGFNVVQ